jgi:GNAT superfamily N-acetyltransferase
VTVEIEPFRVEDQAEVRQLILDGLEEHWGGLAPDLNADLDDIAATYGHGTILVARLAGEIVGVGAIVPTAPGVGEVKRMSVAQDHRREGVATAVLRELVGVAVREHWVAVTVETTASWTDAVQFYERLGFRLTHYEEGQFGRDAHVRMDLTAFR